MVEVPLELLEVGGWTFVPTLNVKGATKLLRRAGRSIGIRLQVSLFVYNGYYGVSVLRTA